MGYSTKQKILNRRILKCRNTLKDTFNILSHQGNANQNSNEIPSYTSQNDLDKKTTMIACAREDAE